MLHPRVNIERTLRALFAVLCLATALAPLARSGFDGDDLDLLARASGHTARDRVAAAAADPSARPGRPIPLGELSPLEVMDFLGNEEGGDVGSLLSGYSVALSQRLYGTGDDGPFGVSSAVWYRVENLVWLVVAALGTWRFLWRIYRPWVGSDQASRASSAAAFLFVLHPLAVPSVAALDGRADLMALAFGTWAAAAFLRGRQERRYGFVYLAGVLCLLAGLCGQVALMLPLCMALAEVFSSYRYRPLSARVRTAIVTLLVFSAVVQLNTFIVAMVTRHGYYPSVWVTLLRLGGIDGALRALALSVEKVGVLLLPANLATLGFAGLFGAGILGLVALQPALIAARTAPRLWGWTLVCWAAAVAVSLSFGVHERVRLDGLATARTLLPATIAMCAGWGLAATALPGLRRIGVPAALALGFSFLAHGNAVAWERASTEYARFQRSVRDRAPSSGTLLVVDAPRRVAGMDPIGAGLPWILHPLFDPEAAWPPAVRVVDVAGPAFGHLVRSGEFDRWRSAGLRVAVPDGDGSYRFVDVADRDGTVDRLEWSDALASPLAAIDPVRAAVLELEVAGPGAREGARASWIGGAEDGSAPIATWYDRAEDGHALLDLADLTAWVLAGTVERVRLEGLDPEGLSARIVPELPLVDRSGELAATDGGDWTFGVLRDVGARGSVRLDLLDLATLDSFEVDGRVGANGTIRFDRPVAALDDLRRAANSKIHYELVHVARDGSVTRTGGLLPEEFLGRRR
ncbi:MAG: hypothetical protein R3F34_01150 [Planctomycetota bacterium]